MESLSDIVAQMRGRGEDGRVDRHLWNEYADRIEAAAKRVGVSKTETVTVGNSAAMREALVAVKKSIDGIGESSLDCDPTILLAALTQVCARLSARIERALSAPPRQCDVGTPGEQRVRFESFCKRKGDGFSASAYCAYECPCGNKGDCKLAWAQTPYAEEGAGK